ncbi:MAG: hypothetical protein IPL39_18110 [Opitutaceae bacterium]|nr:hypothetical protein [Opitutaceae bacterium]
MSPPPPGAGIATGTEVVIRNLHRNFCSLLEDEVRLLAAQHFGAHLTEYPSSPSSSMASVSTRAGGPGPLH